MDTKDTNTKDSKVTKCTVVLNELLEDSQDVNHNTLIKEVIHNLSLYKSNSKRIEALLTLADIVDKKLLKKQILIFDKRSFHIVVSSIISKSVSIQHESFGDKPYCGRYLGDEPSQAAKKAFTQICRKIKVNQPCEIDFSIKETTRDSEKRIYQYVGLVKKIEKFIIVKIVEGKRHKDYATKPEEIKDISEYTDDHGVVRYRRYEGEEVSRVYLRSVMSRESTKHRRYKQLLNLPYVKNESHEL